MKTAKIFSVLSLALIFAAFSAGYAKKVENPVAKSTQATKITYQVVLHMDNLSSPCNVYLIKVVDESGRMIAPAQAFKPGVYKYTFIEKVTAKTNKFSRRSAILEPAKYPDHYVCVHTLVATPDIMFGPFFAGQTYFFDLYPRIQGDRGEE